MHIALLALAVVTAAARPADVDAYIKVSGITAQMSQTSALVISGFDDAMAKRGLVGNPQHLDGLRSAISEVYAAERVMTGIRGQLLKSLDAGALRKTLEFYKTPLAQKVTELEIAVSTVEGMNEVQRFAATLQENPPAPARLKLVAELDRAVRGTDMGLDLMVGTVRGMLAATQAILPKEKRLDAMQMAKVLGDVRANNRPGLEQMSIVTSLYTYRSLTDRELSQYIAFWASPPGKSMSSKTGAAMNVTFEKLAVDLGDISAALAEKYPAK